MATPTSRAAEAHRSAQARLAEVLVTLTGRSYRAALTPSDPKFTAFDTWLSYMLPLIISYRQRSTALSNDYLRRVGLTPVAPEPFEQDAARTSLVVTGWAGLLSRIEKGLEPAAALDKAVVEAAGAADRHALNGGRSATARTLQAQTRLAWYRVTRPDCCAWCAMLSSRGAVYGPDSFADSDPRFIGDGTVKIHDHCHCTLAALERDAEVPDVITQRTDLWESVTRDEAGKIILSGDAAIRAFRTAYEANLRQT